MPWDECSQLESSILCWRSSPKCEQCDGVDRRRHDELLLVGFWVLLGRFGFGATAGLWRQIHDSRQKVEFASVGLRCLLFALGTWHSTLLPACRCEPSS